MSSLIFKGDPSDDVTEFIRQIRAKAFDKSKIHDDGWMADLASTCFSGGAERWYDDLPPKTKESWNLLHEALEQKYDQSSSGPGGLGQGLGGGLGQGLGGQGGLSGPGGLGQGLGGQGGLSGPGGLGQSLAKRGRIQVQANGLSTPHYIFRDKYALHGYALMFGGCYSATPTPSDALIVTVEDTAKPDRKLLRLDNGSYLGVVLCTKDLNNFTSDANHWGGLIDVDKNGSRQDEIAKFWIGESKAAAWEVNSDGSLVFHWERPEATYPMYASYTNNFQHHPSAVFIEIVAGTEYFKKYGPEWQSASYVFEELPRD